MRFLEICLLFNGLFDYLSQFQAVDFITERSPCKETLTFCQLFGKEYLNKV